jgi:hypothetical protein
MYQNQSCAETVETRNGPGGHPFPVLCVIVGYSDPMARGRVSNSQRRQRVPWDAVTYIEQIRKLLDTYFGSDYFGADGIGYSIELDTAYYRRLAANKRYLRFLPPEPPPEFVVS